MHSAKPLGLLENGTITEPAGHVITSGSDVNGGGGGSGGGGGGGVYSQMSHDGAVPELIPFLHS